MDNFVAQLRNNIKINPDTGKETKSSRLREILYYVSISNPEIKILDKCDEYGDIRFEIPFTTLGITHDLLVKYEREIYSEFVANFLGELLVRENLNQFAKILTNICPQQYPLIVDKYEHIKFGLKVEKNKFVFRFHISLLQEILLEDIRRTVR